MRYFIISSFFAGLVVPYIETSLLSILAFQLFLFMMSFDIKNDKGVHEGNMSFVIFLSILVTSGLSCVFYIGSFSMVLTFLFIVIMNCVVYFLVQKFLNHNKIFCINIEDMLLYISIFDISFFCGLIKFFVVIQ